VEGLGDVAWNASELAVRGGVARGWDGLLVRRMFVQIIVEE
jgi:hypothetical protein